jgi:hypothetical protein
MSAEDDRLRIRLAEIMSSAGLGYNQISLEILYLIPREFVDQYIALWEKALGAAGSGDKAGQQLHRDAQLGKHKTETAAKGKKIGAGRRRWSSKVGSTVGCGIWLVRWLTRDGERRAGRRY